MRMVTTGVGGFLLVCWAGLVGAAPAWAVVFGLDHRESVAPFQWSEVSVGALQPSGCAATAVSPKWVVTALHCLLPRLNRGDTNIELSKVSWQDGEGSIRRVVDVRLPLAFQLVRHEIRNAFEFYQRIAFSGQDWVLLELDVPVQDFVPAVSAATQWKDLVLRSYGFPRVVNSKTVQSKNSQSRTLFVERDCRARNRVKGRSLSLRSYAASPSGPLLDITCDVTAGSSGGPLLTFQQGRWRIAGIHSYARVPWGEDPEYAQDKDSRYINFAVVATQWESELFRYAF